MMVERPSSMIGTRLGWGHVAEWLRSGLQNRLPRFNSGRGLQTHHSAYPGKVAANIGFTRYRRIKVRKSETSDLRGFPQRICANG
jgi:hypothetical protein